jgi:magnesium transporter
MTLPTLNATEPVGFLVHGLIDYVVDTHLSAAERLDDELEGLEDMLFDDRPTDREVQWRTYELRKSLVHMRRVSLPMQEAVLSLQRRDLGYIDAELQPYFQDVYDHVLRTTEWLDSLREMVATVFEAHLNARSNRLNVIMKQVISWAAIIRRADRDHRLLRYERALPRLRPAHRVLDVIVAIAALSGLLYTTFKRKGWL